MRSAENRDEGEETGREKKEILATSARIKKKYEMKKMGLFSIFWIDEGELVILKGREGRVDQLI